MCWLFDNKHIITFAVQTIYQHLYYYTWRHKEFTSKYCCWNIFVYYKCKTFFPRLRQCYSVERRKVTYELDENVWVLKLILCLLSTVWITFWTCKKHFTSASLMHTHTPVTKYNRKMCKRPLVLLELCVVSDYSWQ